MQEELLQFKLQKVWVLVDLPYGKKEEGIDYDEVFAPVATIEAIRLFLAFASYMGFTVYQIDVKSAFLYGTIKEEVYVHQPPGFVDQAHPNKVYKVIKALCGLHQALRAWYETLSSFLMENGFRRGTKDKTLFIKKKKSDIMLVQVYVDDIIFGSTKKSMCTEFEECMHKRFQMSSMGELSFFLGFKTATTPIESNKPVVKDEDGVDVDVHVYRDSPFELEAYSDSEYRGANLDRKSTIVGCQFLGRRLISWQSKKQTIVANSTTKAEYVAAANCSTIEERQNDLVYNLYRMLCEQTDFANGDVFHSVLWVLERDMDGTKEFLLSNLFNFWLTKVSTDRLKVSTAGKVSTTIKPLEKIPLEKTDGNTEFHQMMDFLTHSLIYYALTISPIVSTSFVEQFWTTAKSRTVNNTSYIDVIVACKPVTISEASIRSYLLFDDANGIDSLNNQDIFDNIQLMGYD
ncbi:putative ribonuclease H-like domain-containing protein, partial [Tanacetum coccineum]